METNKRLALSNIAGSNIADEMAKTTTQAKVIMYPDRSITQANSEKSKGIIRKGYSSDKQYLAVTETQKDQKYRNAFIRRRTGVWCWAIIGNFPLMPINFIIKDQKQKGN